MVYVIFMKLNLKNTTNPKNGFSRTAMMMHARAQKNAEGKILTPLLGRGRRPPSSEGAGARARARALSTRSEIFTDQAETLHSVSTFKNLLNATLEKSVAARGADNE